MKSEVEKINYTKSLAELQQIVDEMEQGNIDLDNLVEKMKRAKELIALCNAKLKHVQTEVDKLLDEK